MEEEDPIVCEFPVHLAEELRGNVCMLQFPLRPTYRPMPTAPKAARYKPENQILQLDYEVDQKSAHYDRDAEDYLKQKQLRLHSSKMPSHANYAVAVFRQGQVHITPISTVLQMRPSLAHIDDAADDEVEDMEISEPVKAEEPAAEVKEVQLQFKKKQSERAISAIQSSYAYKKQQINAEQWKELKVFERDAEATEEEFENLFSEREEEVVSTLTADEYLKALRYRTKTSPAEIGNRLADTEEKEQKQSETATSSLNANQLRILQILKTDNILHFDELCTLVPKLTEEEVAAALRVVATSVRGRLLPKSLYLCEGTEIDARNKILLELSKKTPVRRADLVEKLSLCPDSTKKHLEHVAALDSTSRTWTFKIPADDTFAKRFPDVAKAIKL
ncbi:TPA: hypothetical protein N0F65_003829 [Lagenidium giganteum]|uniref:DNA-directed RNA polymerase III subunit RPC5 n=1 Tax=Lagenidium giganteum TaxID=4803 RepID=A0AAV2YUY4_9STRA|nr:TPA: hypothetical protein N0F65_003829 [Lagenidium giganteum]